MLALRHILSSVCRLVQLGMTYEKYAQRSDGGEINDQASGLAGFCKNSGVLNTVLVFSMVTGPTVENHLGFYDLCFRLQNV